MPRYDFTSPGAAAGNAIQQFLMQRFVQQRQAQMDALARQAQEEEQKQKAAELELRTGQERRIADAQKAQMADVENERAFRRAGTIADRALPGDPVDAPTRELLTAQGFGGQVQKTPGIMVPMLGTAPGSDAPLQPEGYAMRGGSQYLSARAAADERAAQAKETAAARAAQAADATASREALTREGIASRAAIAAGANAGTAETRVLRNQFLEQQITAAADKQAEAKAAAANKRNAVKQPAQEALTLIDEIEAEPGFSSAVGARIPGSGLISGSPAATAIAKIDRLKALLDLDVIAQMKAQSRTGATGFGSMSAPELKILEDAAARLGRNQSEASFKAELGRLREKLQRVVAEPETASAPTGGSSFRVVRKH